MIGLEPGALFGGRYEVVRSVGAGGMGAVYLARDRRHPDFQVALKVLYPGVIKTAEARERFRNEIVASYKVNHPNIVRAYEYFDEADFQAYAMEYVDGGDLLERIGKGKVSPPDVVRYLKQLAAGLSAIHKAGIVHRDLKPENIMITKDGVIKITDFGVARLKGSMTLTQAGAMVGTPKYLSPEYVETGECDHRGDIYAVGVIAYELLSGDSPFRENSKVALMVERLKVKSIPLATLVPNCPRDLIRIVEKAMSTQLVSRYQTAKELLRDLELFEEGKAIDFSGSLGPESLKSSPAVLGGLDRILYSLSGGKWAWRRLLTALSWGGLIFLLGGAAFFWSGNLWFRAALNQLPEGVYSGEVTGMLSDARSYPFKVWRTSAGAFVLFGKARCAVAEVDRHNQFACGDLKFEIRVNSIERNQAVGTLTELGWGSAGTWTLSEGEEMLPRPGGDS